MARSYSTSNALKGSNQTILGLKWAIIFDIIILGILLKSDYFRIEMKVDELVKIADYMLKSDYFRIEIFLLTF